VLSRLVQAGIWREEGCDEKPAEGESAADEPTYNATISLASIAPRMPQTAVRGDEEESIESYMDRLMKRVRGGAGETQSTWKADSPSIASPASQAAPVPTVASPEPPQVPAKQPPAEYSPRRAAPELSTNLTAMRDLANSAARTAIDQHVRKHSSRRATQKLLGACVTVGCSLVLAYWAWQLHSLQAAIGAGVGGAIGSYWTMAALRRLSGIKRLDRETENQAAEQATRPVEPAQALPKD